ncbi:hypothetical protein E2C01_015524 [Portunus trituberculatus]|uniref:Uncharacterized protein n=1 Tax=Portunus trituberculatus TaxID=210409 RepID=A0A5B7DM39_PORTR|nr:hypothetical protein [Portunus trituberculatus]
MIRSGRSSPGRQSIKWVLGLRCRRGLSSGGSLFLLLGRLFLLRLLLLGCLLLLLREEDRHTYGQLLPPTARLHTPVTPTVTHSSLAGAPLPTHTPASSYSHFTKLSHTRKQNTGRQGGRQSCTKVIIRVWGAGSGHHRQQQPRDRVQSLHFTVENVNEEDS